MRRSVFALAVNVILALALIPLFGLWGAVLSNVAGSLANCVPILALHRRDADISWWALGSSLRPMAWALLLLTLGSVVVLERGQARIWEPFLLGVGLLALWPIGLRLGRMRLPVEVRDVIVGSLPVGRLVRLKKVLVPFIGFVT